MQMPCFLTEAGHSSTAHVTTRRRILFLADHLGYPGGLSHGVTTYCRTVFPNLVSRDFELRCVFLGHEHPAAATLEEAGIRTIFLEQSKYGLHARRSLRAVLSEYQPHLVHVTQQKSTAIARLLKPMNDYCILAHLHDFDPTPAMLRWVSKLLPQPDRTLCVASAVIPTAISQYGINGDTCIPFYNGLDLGRFRSADPEMGRELRRRLKIPEQAPVIGMSVRIFADKRVDKFVSDMAHLLTRVPAAHVIVGGDGPELGACRALAAQLGISARVHFLGHQIDVRPVILACDVIALYSLVEACPFAAIEALALGKPVVGFAAGGMPEIVSSKRAGFLAYPDDRENLVDFAVGLLQSPERTATMAEDCRLLAAQFSLDRHTASLLEHYRILTQRYAPVYAT